MLYIVATPIGNLGDLSDRAKSVLSSVNVVLCEDTRQTRKLLSHFDIKVPVESFHAHTQDKKMLDYVDRMKQGVSMALVSDAGTPGISDPGYVLVRACIDAGIAVVPIPGASAFLTALMASGLPINRFWYYGFLPAKKGRETLFRTFNSMEEETIVFYESPHRIVKTMEKLAEVMPTRPCVLGRELTKMFEEFLRGTVQDIKDDLSGRKKILGEFVVILGPIG